MQPNTELFRKIHEVIESNPSKLDMNYWEERDSACGTTRCIAGWAVHLTTGQPLYDYDGETQLYDAPLHPSVCDLAEQLDVADPVDFEALAGKLLGLDSQTARNLFYGRTLHVVDFVRLVAQGEGEAAVEYINWVEES